MGVQLRFGEADNIAGRWVMESKILPCGRSSCRVRVILAGIGFSTFILNFSAMSSRYVLAEDISDLSQGLSLADITPPSRRMAVDRMAVDEDVYLNVIVNGEMRDEMYPFRQKENGDFIIRENDLKAIGIVPEKSARLEEEWYDISALPDVVISYDSQQDAIEFVTSSQNALIPYTVSLNPWLDHSGRRNDEEEGKPRADLAAVLNYNLYASSSSANIGNVLDFEGVSGNLEGRVSGPFGTFNSTQLVTYSSRSDDIYRTVRLESYWSYSDTDRLFTYSAGDIVSRSLPWTRSARLGGFQIRRNFTLRSDLVTMPLPSFSGSAVVPSAIDVYINNARRATENIPVGPFSLTDMPIVSGGNKARLVVRDAQGRETVTEMSFFGSSDMLTKGFLDFSMEAGLPRRFYGIRSNDYDGRFFASATARYGLRDNLTVEGHAEAGKSFFNAGIGTVFTLSDFGALSLAGSASTYKGRDGQQISAGLQLQKWGVSLSARVQRAYNDYHDIASVVEERLQNESGIIHDVPPDFDLPSGGLNIYARIRPPRAINQVSLSIPLYIDPANLNFTYTEVKNRDGGDSKYLGFTVSRNFDSRAYGYINAFQDLRQTDSYSIFAGLTIRLDDKHNVTYDVKNDHQGTGFTSLLRRQMGGEIGDYGWTLRDIEGTGKQRGVSGSYRTPFALIAGSFEQYESSYNATVDINGAFVLADSSIMPANTIYDSFAVVNVGAPDVGVYHQNSYYGKTGRNGRIVIPKLISYRQNRLSIDMDTIPLDTLVSETDIIVTPSYQSGIVENFGGAGKSDYIYVSLRDEKGGFIETGSYAGIAGHDSGFDVAYDGMGILPAKGLKYPARIIVERPDNRFCQVILNAVDKNSRGVTAGPLELTCIPVSKNAVMQ